MLLFGGLPLFYLELALGQYYRSGCLTVWQYIAPAFKGIGFAICIIDIYMAMYYNTIIAWAVYYLQASFTSVVPWSSCDNPWNTPECSEGSDSHGNSSIGAHKVSPAQEYFERHVLEVHKSGGLGNMGTIRLPIAFCLLLVFVLVYLALWKGVKSTGKAVYITAIAPYVVLFALLVKGVTLDGAADGIAYYLSPDWAKLAESEVWVDAATQIFFSLGPGFGTLLALSSYNRFHNNCYRDALLTSFINCATSFVAGLVIFSFLGYMAKNLDRDISSVATSGPGLVFIVYPQAISTLQYSPVWSVMFFSMLITLGLDSTFGGLEAMLTGMCDQYPNVLRRHREIFVALVLVFIYICALPTTTCGGFYLVELLDTYATAVSVLFVVFIEGVVICWVFGAERFAQKIHQMLGSTPGIYWRLCWTYISPVFLLTVLIFAFERTRTTDLDPSKYPWWSVRVGVATALSSICLVPLYMIYMFCKSPGTIEQRIEACLTPIEPVNNPTQV
ncbi:sodium-dependent serotonin transporter [Galendromus occidentalis]|uniref:Sodium-dependent serotonin transporter n=1 Tax=Galendromus occidentalis TaxID=34638 RepID=A0AAJ7L8F0_9ACAR|nr:sodium-dependent serotonin transporter [Galendromus occidentalis]